MQTKAAALVPTLARWQRTIVAMERALDSLHQAVGYSEGPLERAAWNVLSEYNIAIGLQVGDTANWLGWYWVENEMGRKRLACKVVSGKERPIGTLHQLAAVIVASR